MKSLLLSLYDGELCPRDYTEASLKECRKAEKITNLFEESFRKKLNEDLTEEFDDLMLKYAELIDLQNAEAFVTGFALGSRFIFEAFSR